MIDIKVEMSGDGARVRVSGEATIVHGEELKRALADTLRICRNVVIHTEETRDMDLSCLQILCSAHRTALGLNRDLTVKSGGAHSLEQAIRDLGYHRPAGCGADHSNSCLFTGGPHE